MSLRERTVCRRNSQLARAEVAASSLAMTRRRSMRSVEAFGVDCAVFVSVVVLSFLAVPSFLSAQAKDALLGTWRLVSVSSSTDNGKVDNEVYGLHPKGLITYTADGRMSVIITNEGRKPLSVNDRLAPPAEER